MKTTLLTRSSYLSARKPAIAVNVHAPVLASETLIIEATPERVWDVLTDLAQWPAWQPNVQYARLNGPLQPNTTFDWKAGGLKIHSTLHTVEALTNMGWTGTVWGLYAIHNWALWPVGERTEVSVSESMDGFLAKLFSRTLTNLLVRDMAQSLQWLKAACEQSSPSGQVI